MDAIRNEIGNLFMIGIYGSMPDSQTLSLIRGYHIGGVILFGRNIEDPVQLAHLCSSLQSESDIPLFISIDQEGGRVSRLKEPFTQFSGSEEMANAPDPIERVMEYAKVTSFELKIVGINMNLAPVMDVKREWVDSCLIGRSYGEDPHTVSLLGAISISEMQRSGIISVAKHFPGLGAVRSDPHRELPAITISEDDIYRTDLPPFISSIKAGVECIMTSHAIYKELDNLNPATLSPKILEGLLRNELGFNGMIITDDLDMGAMKRDSGSGYVALSAIEAGADLLLICHNHENFFRSYEAILKALERGKISKDRIRSSLYRIYRVKEKYIEKGHLDIDRVKEYFDDKKRYSRGSI